MRREEIVKNICVNAYNTLVKMQYDSGEFGKQCEEIVSAENKLRHSNAPPHEIGSVRKPNCSITLIAALGISKYKGVDDSHVIRTAKWFTDPSDFVVNGWFSQKLYKVDTDPFGEDQKLSFVIDVRHTSTALLAALNLRASSSFIFYALNNLLNTDEVRDKNRKGWVAHINPAQGIADFYSTIYMLASLHILKVSNMYRNYDLELIKINQLLNEGLTFICEAEPNHLGYNESLSQTLRSNATLLFFIAPLLAEARQDFLQASIKFLIQNATRSNGQCSWLNNDLRTTINILSGLVKSVEYLNDEQLIQEVTAIITETKTFIESTEIYDSHPASLGFLLFIYSSELIVSGDTTPIDIVDLAIIEVESWVKKHKSGHLATVSESKYDELIAKFDKIRTGNDDEKQRIENAKTFLRRVQSENPEIDVSATSEFISIISDLANRISSGSI